MFKRGSFTSTNIESEPVFFSGIHTSVSLNYFLFTFSLKPKKFKPDTSIDNHID